MSIWRRSRDHSLDIKIERKANNKNIHYLKNLTEHLPCVSLAWLLKIWQWPLRGSCPHHLLGEARIIIRDPSTLKIARNVLPGCVHSLLPQPSLSSSLSCSPTLSSRHTCPLAVPHLHAFTHLFHLVCHPVLWIPHSFGKCFFEY